MIADQLEGVPIAGADEHVHAVVGRHGRERRDDVVGLVTLHRDEGDPQRAEDLLDQRDLPFELPRRRRPAGLVFGVRLGPERLT